jgi:hypothetical protein
MNGGNAITNAATGQAEIPLLMGMKQATMPPQVNFMRRLRFIAILVVLLAPAACKRGSHRPPPPDLFFRPVEYRVGSGPTSIATADVNGDGNPDLIVANMNSKNISTLLGNGDGSFEEQIPSFSAPDPYVLATGEFTGDAFPDLAIIHSASMLLTIMKGNGDGHFNEIQRVNLEKTPTSVLVSDFDGDGKDDIAVSLRLDRIMIFKGTGKGFFILTSDFDPGDTPTGMEARDINRDTKMDLIIANNGNIGRSIAIFAGNGDGTFKKAYVKKTKLVPLLVGSADFNLDDITDLVVVYGERNTLGLLLGQKDGGFADPIPFGAEGGPADLVIWDFNSDGKPDLAVPNNLSHSLSILLGNGDGTFIQPPIDYHTDNVPMSIVKGEFNKGRPVGLAVVNNGSDTVLVFNAKTRAEAAPAPVAKSSSPK